MSNIQSIVVLTGAGVSAESGLKTFRDNDGLWEDHRVEDVATPEAFDRDPLLVQRFYNMRRQQLLQDGLKPNAAHEALANFQKNFSGKFSVITQNVDNLHERAGSKNVIHMHGELLKVFCTNTGKTYDCDHDIEPSSVCECCGLSGSLRPDIVWFGEIPKSMDVIESLLASCDLFISIGTSGTVYPAAGFKQVANSFGAETVELNLEASARGSHPSTPGFDESRYGPATETVPAYLEELSKRMANE